jgi:hypothetical protein
MCSWHPSAQKTKKVTNFQNSFFLKKRTEHHPWKVSLFAGFGFSPKRDDKLPLKSHTKRVVLRMYFEDGLSIPMLKNRATCYKNLQLELVKFLKKSNVFRGRPAHLYFKRRRFQMLVCVDQDSAHQFMSEFPRWLEHIQKSEVMEMVQSRFYSRNETMVKLIVGHAMEWLI